MKRLTILEQLENRPALRTELMDAALRADSGRKRTEFIWRGHKCRLGFTNFRAVTWIKFRNRWTPAACRWD